ncbi:MAG: sigma-70 family RNA polymerase sigma factor [Saccharofermentans sp.]|nr:sigma-70 family RNA polymerase sigma factor [Saccharofermentans sp.]
MTQEQIYNLVEAAKHGDDNAFAQLYEAAYRMVYHVSLGYLKNTEDAEDLTQEVFLKAYSSIHTLGDNLTFFGWVQTMAANRSKNKLRDRKEYVSYEDESDLEKELIGDDNLEFLPDTYIMQETQRQVLENIMRKELSDVQYQTIYMHYYNNLTVEQIAAVMNVPTGTVKTRLKNSRIKIKEGVERYERITNDKINVCGAIPAIGLVIGQTINSTPVSFVPFAKGVAATTAGAAAGTAAAGAATAATAAISTSLLTKVIIGAVAVGTLGVGTVAVVRHNQNSKAAETSAQVTVATTETALTTAQAELVAPIVATTSTETTAPSVEETSATTQAPSSELVLSPGLDSVVETLKSNAASRNYDVLAANNPGVMKYLNRNAFAYSAPDDAIIVIASDYNGDGVNELFICGLTESLEDYKLLEMYSMSPSGAVRLCPIDTDYSLAFYYCSGIGVVSQDDTGIIDTYVLSADGSSLVVSNSYGSWDEMVYQGHSIPGDSVTLKDY